MRWLQSNCELTYRTFFALRLQYVIDEEARRFNNENKLLASNQEMIR